jgi:hypothetical protein
MFAVDVLRFPPAPTAPLLHARLTGVALGQGFPEWKAAGLPVAIPTKQGGG